MNLQKLTIRKPDDMHCHLRRAKILKSVVGFTAKQFARAIIMPNTDPAILSVSDALVYKEEILSCTKEKFQPLMTIQINGQTTPKMVAEAKALGVVAGKVYPQGVTTNSGNGVMDFAPLFPVFHEMEKQGMLLLLHGESPNPNVFCLDREEKFLSTLFELADNFHRLKIVLEHITTHAACGAVAILDNVAATITVHHLILTLDDVVGGFISPHNFCKPIAKRPEDREVLLNAATSGNPKFFYGGDSAPHLRKNKECCYGCAGVFNAPVALPLLAQIFEQRGKLDKLENFVSKFGANFYSLLYNDETIKLIKQNWVVPAICSGIVPFMAGQTLHWQVAN